MSATLEIIKEPKPFKPERVIGLLISNADYSAHVEFGTKPHEINSPVNIKGKWVYIKTHPGTEAQPFMRPAVLETIKRFPIYLKKEILKENPNLRKVMEEFLSLEVVPQSRLLAPVDISNLRRNIDSKVL